MRKATPSDPSRLDLVFRKGANMAEDITIQRLLHSKSEARAFLGGVPYGTFNDWIARGIIVPVRIGRRCFIRHEDLLRLAQAETPEGE